VILRPASTFSLAAVCAKLFAKLALLFSQIVLLQTPAKHHLPAKYRRCDQAALMLGGMEGAVSS